MPLRPHSIRSAILTCVLRTAYNPRQHESTEFRCIVSYHLALLTSLWKRLDTNCTTKRMPRSQIVLCIVPYVQFALQCALVSVPRIVWRGTTTALSFVSPQVGIRSSWWERRVIIERWERAGKEIQRGLRILLVNMRVSQVLLQRLFAVERSIAVVAVKGGGMNRRVA